MQDLTLRRLRKEAHEVQKRAEYEVDRLRKRLRSRWDGWVSTPTTRDELAVRSFIAGGVSLIAVGYISARYIIRIPNADYVAPYMLDSRRWLKGYVTRVGDSDNFRLFHTPGLGWKTFRTIPKKRTDLKDETINIRIAGIDAPESSYFGREAQPGADKSLAWLKKRIEGKFVCRCRLLRRDQYGRIIAEVLVKPRFLPSFLFGGGPFSAGCSLSLMMLRAGMAAVYEQKGAEYGDHGVACYKRAQEEAQRHKRGIWRDGTDVETPAEYKRRIRAVPATSAGSDDAVLPISPPIAEESSAVALRTQ